MQKKAKLALLIVTLMLAAVISGCGNSGTPAADGGDAGKKELKVYNWGEYIDKDVLKDFEAKTGVKVIYDTFDTNEEMYAKVKPDTSSYDVVFPSDYMIKRMADEGMLAELDFAKIPNYSFIEDRFKNLAFDPENKFSVPYMWGTVGIVYNKELVTEKVDSWNILWDKKYAKKILMIDSHRDSIAPALKLLGFSLNTTKPEELNLAKEKLLEQKSLVLAYVADEMKDKMMGEEAALSLSWSGEALALVYDDPDRFDYVVPKEGSNWFVDSMVVLAGSKNKEAAAQFVNFMCETEVATKNCDYIRYSTPHSGAKEQMKEIDADFVNDPRAFPSVESLKNSEVFIIPGEAAKTYDEIWQQVKAH